MANKKANGSFWKDYWAWIVFVLFWLTIVPFIINQLILSEKCWDVVGGPVEWLAFWPSYLSALASAVMIGFTAKTLNNNNKQLDELKRQWDEEHRPNVSVSFHRIGVNGYLRIINISNVEIKDLGIEILEIPEISTIRKVIEQYPDVKEDIEVKHMYIEPRGIRNIILAAGFCNDLLPNEYIGLKLKYNTIYENAIRVTFNQSYSIGDDLIGRELVDSIDRLRNVVNNLK
jgi:hypothetical protein